MRIWVTRTAPENEVTAARLKALGHEVVRAPVLDVRRAAAEPLSIVPDAIVFTSCNGVRHHPVRRELLHVPVFAVGDRTAREAAAAGYGDVRSAAGDITDLQRLILEQLPAPARIVHFGARDLAGDLNGFLRRFGYLVERRTVYSAQSVAIRWLLEVRTQLGSIDGILIHSPRAADRVARVLAGTRWRGQIWCISEACALRLAGIAGIEMHFAARPTEAALMALVRETAVARMPAQAPLRAAANGGGRPIRLDPEAPANDNDQPWPEWPGGARDPDGEPPPAA